MTADIKRDWWKLACLFLAPQVPQSKTAQQITEEEEREIAKWEAEHPQIRDTKGTQT